jgi:hypothetical protein
MRFSRCLLTFTLVISMAGVSYCGETDDDSDDGGGMSGAVKGILLGGLLGGGAGAAIGSASGNAGKGALIGAGVGALGGGLIGANQDSKKARTKGEAVPVEEPGKLQVKKRVVKEYDDEGNVVSEKEIAA